MPNYTKGQIYMIEPKCEYEEGDIYYGSTIQPLSKRVGLHRSKSNSCLSKILIEKYGEVKIVLVKLFPCNSKQELEAEEARFIRENKCINKNIPLRTDKEYREDNKEKIKECCEKNKEKKKEYDNNYREDNKEKIKEYFKEKITCDCGCIVLKTSIYRHKQSPKHLKNMP